MSATPSLIVQNLRMPGQEFDSDTGLYHNGFRDYAPGLGRYLQSDPLGIAAGLNTYGYAKANPVNSIDPLGLSAQDVENALAAGWSTVQDFSSDALQAAKVQWDTEQGLGLPGYLDQLPCTAALKKWGNDVSQLYDQYGAPIKTAVDWFKAIANAAEDEATALIGLLPQLFCWAANNSQYWGNERIPPPPQANPAINDGTWGNPNNNRTPPPPKAPANP